MIRDLEDQISSTVPHVLNQDQNHKLAQAGLVSKQ